MSLRLSFLARNEFETKTHTETLASLTIQMKEEKGTYLFAIHICRNATELHASVCFPFIRFHFLFCFVC